MVRKIVIALAATAAIIAGSALDASARMGGMGHSGGMGRSGMGHVGMGPSGFARMSPGFSRAAVGHRQRAKDGELHRPVSPFTPNSRYPVGNQSRSGAV